MGGEYPKFNNEKNLTINIESNKVCYFPGEIMSGTITLFPFLASFEKIKANPKLEIIIAELKHYCYSTGSKHHNKVSRDENRNLVNTSIDFGSLVTSDFSAGFKVPFSIQIPNDAYPTLCFRGGYVKHCLIVELPDLDAKKGKMFAIKNNFPNNVDNTLLRNMIEVNKECKKTKLFFEIGSCLFNFKMPKNYFFYNEKIPFEINIDCSNLKMEIKAVKISLFRISRLNDSHNYSKIARSSEEKLNEKKINLEKGLNNNYHVSDFIEFPTSSDYNSVYPPNVYSSFEEHGLVEIDDSKFEYKLYPSSINGLVSVDYFIGLRIYFDSSFTLDEEFSLPIYFSSNFENNYNNNYKSNSNYNMNPMVNQGVSDSVPYVSSKEGVSDSVPYNSSNDIYYYNNNNNTNITPQ